MGEYIAQHEDTIEFTCVVRDWDHLLWELTEQGCYYPDMEVWGNTETKRHFNNYMEKYKDSYEGLVVCEVRFTQVTPHIDNDPKGELSHDDTWGEFNWLYVSLVSERINVRETDPSLIWDPSE